MMIIIECRVVEIAMIVEIRKWLLCLWLLEMDASLLLGFLMLAQRLNVHVGMVVVLVDFNWLSYLWFVLPATNSALNSNHMACFKWWIAPQTWHQE